MQAHGSRRTVNLCLTCHTDSWVQAPGANNTANPIDFRQMIHQIHAGQLQATAAAPRVYKWSATTDFSTVQFAPPNTVKNCGQCHQGAQAGNAYSKPSQKACGSCHYLIDWSTGAGHPAGVQGDATCVGCHAADTNGVVAATSLIHSPRYNGAGAVNATFAGNGNGGPRVLTITLDTINVATPAASTVTFTAKIDGVAADIKAVPLGALTFVIGGPTSDYAGAGGPSAVGYVSSASYAGAGAANLVATATPGQYTAALPDLTAANGQSIGVGVEAYSYEYAPVSGTCNAATGPAAADCILKAWTANYVPVKYAKVGATTGAVARRAITDNAKCNACHADLGFHSNSSRKGPEYCAVCHNSRNVNDERTSQYEVVPGTATPYSKTPNTVQLSVMVHKIHKAGDLANAYSLGATRDFRASVGPPARAEGEAPPQEFAGAFPGDIRDCMVCHVSAGNGLPEANVLPTRYVAFTCIEDPAADTNAVCGTLSASGGVVAPDSTAGAAFWSKTESFVGAGASHCGSCHDTAIASTHFQANTVGGVESCDVCHGDGRFMDPVELHIPAP